MGKEKEFRKVKSVIEDEYTQGEVDDEDEYEEVEERPRRRKEAPMIYQKQRRQEEEEEDAVEETPKKKQPTLNPSELADIVEGSYLRALENFRMLRAYLKI